MAAPGARAHLLLSGAATSALWVLLSLWRPERGELRDLHVLAVVSIIIVSSLLLAEALSIASPAFEVLFGLIAGWLGVKSGGSLDALALMGSSALMFLVGLEIDLAFIRENLARSAAIGLASFAAPMALTVPVMMVLGSGPLEATLTGVAVSTTSVAVVYSIIKRFVGVKSPAGQLALSSAMIADIASILAFSALVVRTSTGLLVYLASLAIAPPLLSRLLRGLPELGYEGEVRIIIALLLAVTLASEVVGVHAVLASFILGLALQEFANEPPVRDKIEALITGFLAPLFFVAAGITASMASPGAVALLALLLLAVSYPPKALPVAVLSKLRGGLAWRVAASFGARLTVSTLIAFVGVRRGIIGPSLAGAIMLSAVMATMLAGVLVRGAEPLFEA